MDARAAVEVRFEYLDDDSQRGTHEKSSLTECAAIIAAAALDADNAVLILTGDFEQSVRDRYPIETPHLDDRERGEDAVGAKVMAVGEEIHVILTDLYFEPNPDPSFGYELRNRLVTRTVRHEAGHVAMEQAGEADGPTIDGEGAARRRLLLTADEVISEYRSDLDVALEYRTVIDGFTPEEIASWLRASLTRITTVDFQAHRDAERVAYDVSDAVGMAAKLLAPNAAERVLRGLEPRDAFEDTTTAIADWREMIEPVWEGFAGALDGIPPASARVSRGDLDRATARLADVLNAWLLRLKVEWNDGAQVFRITSFAVYEEPLREEP
ncbi:hypothetical protein HQQ80_16730 [Microbacteriaceae bacterium VKM Ac-2855]|nr:hypothetical protein [Microbacteriaceae bacterium VKM Ac-2855]